MESTVNIRLDLSGLDKIKRACEILSKPIKVGIINNAEEAEIGALQHFGGTGYYQYGEHEGEEVQIPPRPFISAPVERFGGDILKMSLKKVFNFTEKGAEQALKTAGHLMAEDIKYWMNMETAYPPENSPRTVETKGFNHPLIDKGTLRDSITYEVEK